MNMTPEQKARRSEQKIAYFMRKYGKPYTPYSARIAKVKTKA